VANSQDSAHPDLLAAVVLHTLVSEGRAGMSVARVAIACGRDPSVSAEVEEIGVALRILLDDELALHEEDLYQPTRAAIRAAELSF
jgi:hypothetical protein